jgi:hypothetical protein
MSERQSTSTVILDRKSKAYSRIPYVILYTLIAYGLVARQHSKVQKNDRLF